jgi:hypothetical protein
VWESHLSHNPPAFRFTTHSLLCLLPHLDSLWFVFSAGTFI